MKSNPLVDVIVLAWNHVEDTIECLESLFNSDYQPIRFVLVDNASTDGTSDIIQNRFSSVEVLRSEVNLGVSGGFNIGMEYAIMRGAEFILIANNDISVDPDAIRYLVADMERKPQAGIGMPKIYHYFGDRDRLWCTGARWRRFPPSVKMLGVNAHDTKKYSLPYELEYAPSCFLLIRGEVIDNIGYFDTDYFFYNDDWDYSARTRKSGYTIRFVPQAKIWHKVSISTQKSDKPAQWWHYYGRSTFRFYIMHKNLIQLAAFITWFVIREMLKGKFQRIPPFLNGIKTEQSIF